MNNPFNNLNSLGCAEELEARLNQMRGILITLESAMESENGFITIQSVAKYAVTAAMNMADECGKINQREFELLHCREH